MSDHLEGLNPAQRRAAEHTTGPLLVLAGAGAGKTKTITHRILNLVHSGISPDSILAITFTNKAAKEMRERITTTLRKANISHSAPFVSTFHSLGVQIIKENSNLLGVPRHFTILDRRDAESIVKNALKESGYDPKQFSPGKILNTISREKGRYKTQSQYSAEAGNDFFPGLVAEIWGKYDAQLRKEKSFDFDDLLLVPTKLLEQNEVLRKNYNERWTHIHIDEYQDTNDVQYTLARLLAGVNHNVCVVGDGDQNVYSWRGAELRHILNFEKDYPEAELILLEQNYRSTKTILQVANDIIAKNTFRKDKKLFTKNDEGENMGLYIAMNESGEAQFVAEKTSELIESGVNPEEIAVLYRANFQSRALEEAFLRSGTPYQMLGTKFFERKEVKDVLSYLRAALNPDSLGDIKRSISAPKRGVGNVSLLKIFEGKRDELSGKAKTAVDAYFKLLEKIKEKASTDKPSDVLKYIVEKSGIEIELKYSKKDDDEERYENIKELVSLATKYDELSPEEAKAAEGSSPNSQSEFRGIEKLLSDSALQSDQDELSEVQAGAKLMTVHASKGLEFEYVFIVGLEEGLFPHERHDAHQNTEESEEERRLFYVALTRAKKKVFLSYANTRMIYGSAQVNMPSQFILDIDDSFIEEEGGGNKRGGGTVEYLVDIDF